MILKIISEFEVIKFNSFCDFKKVTVRYEKYDLKCMKKRLL